MTSQEEGCATTYPVHVFGLAADATAGLLLLGGTGLALWFQNRQQRMTGGVLLLVTLTVDDRAGGLDAPSVISLLPQ